MTRDHRWADGAGAGARAAVFITCASASVDERDLLAFAVLFELVPVAPDQAHVLLDAGGSIAEVYATTVGTSPWTQPPHEARETRWFITALGLDEQDAAEAVDRALTALRKDVEAGRVRPGTHPGLFSRRRNVLESSAEMLLGAYREEFLRDAERAS